MVNGKKEFCCEDMKTHTWMVGSKIDDDLVNKVIHVNNIDFYLQQYSKQDFEVIREQDNTIIFYNEKYDEYGIPIFDGGRSNVIIKYCPWCGCKL